MRTIKFRAWDADDNEMYVPQVLAFGMENKLMPLRKCKDGNSAYKHHVLMEYTGLKDKNDKEIYEGDVLKKGNGHIHFVIYKNASFCKDVNVHLTKIIGNIYENPELLTSDGKI